VNEVALKRRIAALVVAAFLSLTGASVAAAAVADGAQAALAQQGAHAH
jgi:hypothetical protein